MSLVNYLGTFETLDQVWESYPEGGKEGDYIYIGTLLQRWDKYTLGWVTPTDDDLQGLIIEVSEHDVVEGSSRLINYLGRVRSLEEAMDAFPEGGNEGDYLYVGDVVYAWDKYSNQWIEADEEPQGMTAEGEEILGSSRFVNYLGGFVDFDAVWGKYPEGGDEGDYLYVAGELHIWNKYIRNWEVAEPPVSSEQRPIEVLSQEGVVEYSENYINYLGVFDTIDQAWEAYPEGGVEGDYIIVGGEQLRWNKYTSNWGEVDPGSSTPARPVATIYGDLHVHNDLIVGEDLIAKIFDKYAPKWMLSKLTPIRVETEEQMQEMIDTGMVTEGQLYYVPEDV